MKKLWAFSLLLMVKVGLAAGGAGVPLDHWDRSKANDLAALQNGAKLFANYCIGCHAAGSMRWNRLRDLGLTQEQIETYLLPPGQRVGDLMTIAMAPADAQRWLNKAPPDLSVITRARTSFDYAGVDYLYTFLRAYYRDSASATGWNNWVFPNIGMPHVLWQRQGPREVTIARVEHGAEDAKTLVRTQTVYDAQGHAQTHQETLSGRAATGMRVSVKPADVKQARQFDEEVGDLVAYLHYMTEPVRSQRQRWGIWVLLFIGVFAILAWRLNTLYWKDIK
ncbi:MAG TPA: cytochrome c1 [Burkholderiaceae bacterium]|nr:cytochrome c1 [Burkholderiaceae bacterium]